MNRVKADIVIGDYDLVRTCTACPEQYDVFVNGTDELVGYLRLRNGFFRAQYPRCGGREVYVGHPKGDGIFYNDERDSYLHEAIAAIHLARKGLPSPNKE